LFASSSHPQDGRRVSGRGVLPGSWRSRFAGFHGWTFTRARRQIIAELKPIPLPPVWTAYRESQDQKLSRDRAANLPAVPVIVIGAKDGKSPENRRMRNVGIWRNVLALSKEGQSWDTGLASSSSH
jgi:hypothetical protein